MLWGFAVVQDYLKSLKVSTKVFFKVGTHVFGVEVKRHWIINIDSQGIPLAQVIARKNGASK